MYVSRFSATFFLPPIQRDKTVDFSTFYLFSYIHSHIAIDESANMSTEIEVPVEATAAAAPQGMRKNGELDRGLRGGARDEREEMLTVCMMYRQAMARTEDCVPSQGRQ